MRHIESNLQKSCVAWFRLSYPEYRMLLFAIPNGSRRDKVTASILKSEGVQAGVSDTILLLPRNGYASLCVEFKTVAGRQSENQKKWQEAAESAGNKYVIVRSFDEFVCEIKKYMS